MRYHFSVSEASNNTSVEPVVPAFTLKAFLEGVPPGEVTLVSELVEWRGSPQKFLLCKPDITLYCGTEETCGGFRQFRTVEDVSASHSSPTACFVNYVCRNCLKTQKRYALTFRPNKEDGIGYGIVFKYGEDPGFGPPTPTRLLRLLGPDSKLFSKGRRAENQSMGIAAFAYYRRVIENQKDAIFDEIIRVSRGISADPAIIQSLEEAKKQIQFVNAVDSIKAGIPPALFIDGHSPLVLMHAALSEGLHAKTDEECLRLATDLRIVMADFVERMAQALKDDAELHSAVSRLLNRNRQKAAAPTPASD